MTHKDFTDDDIPLPRAAESEPRVTSRAPIGRDFLDDDLLLSRPEPGLRARPRSPIGRDFLNEDLPLTRAEGLPRSSVYTSSRLENSGEEAFSAASAATREPTPAERQPIERDNRYNDEREARRSAAYGAERVSDRVVERAVEPPVAAVADEDLQATRAASRQPASTRVRRAPQPVSETEAPSERNSKAGLMIAALLVAVCAAGAGGWFWFNQGGFGAKPAAPAGEPIKNAFYEQAQGAGAVTCSRIFPLLGQMATLGAATYSVQSSWNQDTPDKHGIYGLTGLSYDRADLKGAGAGLVFATPSGGRCEGTAMRVLPLPMACSEVEASRLPAGTTKSADLEGVPLYDLANNTGKLMLVPASDRVCAVVTIMFAEN